MNEDQENKLWMILVDLYPHKFRLLKYNIKNIYWYTYQTISKYKNIDLRPLCESYCNTRLNNTSMFFSIVG